MSKKLVATKTTYLQMFHPPDEDTHRQAVSELGESAVFLYRWWQSQKTGGLQ